MMFRKETEFQETEIGKIPKDWKIEKLSSLATIIMGQSPPSNTYNREGKGLPFIQGKMEFGRMYPSPTMYTSRPLKIAEEGDILMSVRAPVGDVNIAPYKLCIGRGLATIRFNSKIANNLFYFYYLQSIKNRLENLGKGSTFKAITKKDLEELRIVYPPLSEQKGIADILLMVDRGIEIVDKTVAKLERIKRALLNELLTGSIRVREENGKLTFYKETEFQDTEIGEIPKDWKLVKLSNIVEDIYYGITAKAVEHKTGLKILRTTDIKDYNVDWDSLPFCEITEKRGNIQRFLLKKGDIIIARAGTTGVCVLVEKDFEDVIFGSYLIKIRLNKNVYPRFIYYFCQSHSYWNQITSGQAGSTIKNINIPLLKSLNVPLPSSVKEQTAITEILSTVDKAIELYRREKERLLRLKRGLMSVLLTGRVRVVSDVRDVEVNV